MHNAGKDYREHATLFILLGADLNRQFDGFTLAVDGENALQALKCDVCEKPTLKARSYMRQRFFTSSGRDKIVARGLLMDRK